MRSGILFATILHLGGATVFLGLGNPSILSAQNGPQVQPDPAPIESTPPQTRLGDTEPITPGGAFLRSVLIPGWGHAATEAYGRGGFYVAAQAAAVWMLGKSLHRRSEARVFHGLEREVVRDRLVAEGITDPETLRATIDDDPDVQEWQSLVESRGDQVEDWAVAAAFLVLLGGADAFVTAHFLDYPEPLSLQVNPWGPRGIEVGFSIPVLGIPEASHHL